MTVDATHRLLSRISRQANFIRTRGITVSGVHVGTDALGLIYLSGLADKAELDPRGFSTQFVISPTETVTLNSAQILSMKDAAQTFVSAMFVAEATANAGASANPPTITTLDEVMAIFNAVNKSY